MTWQKSIFSVSVCALLLSACGQPPARYETKSILDQRIGSKICSIHTFDVDYPTIQPLIRGEGIQIEIGCPGDTPFRCRLHMEKDACITAYLDSKKRDRDGYHPPS